MSSWPMLIERGIDGIIDAYKQGRQQLVFLRTQPLCSPTFASIQRYWGHVRGHRTNQEQALDKKIKGLARLFWFNV